MCIPFLCQNSTLVVNLTFDNIIRLLIEERLTILSKMFLLFSSSFLSRIQQKKRRGTDNLGLCFGKTIFRCLSPRDTVYGRKKSSRLAQLNLVSLGTKGNYNEGQELFLPIVLVCKLSCS